MKIYTKTGDKGETGLVTGQRVLKDDIRVETYGTVDEVSSVLGMARALTPVEKIKNVIWEIQNRLFVVGAELASEGDTGYGGKIGPHDVKNIELLIDQLESQLPPLTEFILPGDTPGSAALHVARTVVRRAERLAVRLSREQNVGEDVLIYLNRLSDLFFVMARLEAEQAKK
jgi:cob(I)alamin adenosyltransferase